MSFYIRECLTEDKGCHIDWNYKNVPVLQESAQQPVNTFAQGSIIAEHEALHSVPTRNNTWYTEEALESCVASWTYPYPRPLIMHHNERDGKIIGRIVKAHYKKKSNLSNTGALCLTANVPDEEGKKGIKNGTLLTVSIGAIVHEATCSICGHDIAREGECEHERGEVYDGKTCYWMIHKMEAKELSYVIVPSNPYAQITSWREVGQKEVTENLCRDLTRKGAFNIMENLSANESKIIDEKITDQQDTHIPEAPETTPEEDKTSEDELTTLKQEHETLKQDHEALKQTHETLKQEHEVLKQEHETLKATLQKELDLRHELEKELKQFKAVEKNSLVENVYELRSKLNKREIGKESLQEKSLEFLTESLEDLKEEWSMQKDKKEKETQSSIQEHLSEVNNPAFVKESTKKDVSDVKENEANSNMNVEENLINIFSSVL